MIVQIKVEIVLGTDSNLLACGEGCPRNGFKHSSCTLVEGLSKVASGRLPRSDEPRGQIST